MSEYHFYDTSALIENEDLFSNDEKVVISSITLEELDKLKTSNYKARQTLKIILENFDKLEILFYNDSMLKFILEKGELSVTPDIKILASALHYDIYIHPDETIFYTNDRLLSVFANLFFGEDSIREITPKEDTYKGYEEITLSDEELAQLYENPMNNIGSKYDNSYLIVRNDNGEIIDKLRWTNGSYSSIKFGSFSSTYFGTIKPEKDDPYQACAFDSLLNNKITMLKGPAGSGKSLLAMSYLFHQLEKNKIDKIIVFCNTVATKNSARLG